MVEVELRRIASELDLTNLRDEELVALATQSGSHHAVVILLLRYRDWSRHLILRLARFRGLTHEDTEDAQQDGVFGILKAISRYDTLNFSGQNGCLFQTFLRRVLTNRFKDFLKHLRRIDRRYGRPLPSFQALTRAGRNGDKGMAWLLAGRESDPALLAERQELMVMIHYAISNLDAVSGRLVGGLLSGRPLRAVAGDLGISYDAAKRRWRRLRTRLAERLRGLIG